VTDVATIKARFKESGVPLAQSDTWAVQKATVIKHSALERLAAACEIAFDPPQVIRSEADEAVICVTGRMGGKAEWSFGEARVSMMRDSGKTNKWGKPEMEPVNPDAPGNYVVSGKQAAYPYAMAEKRAKDRVIIKLVGLHGVYSSEEADVFDEPQSDPQPPRAPASTPPTDDNPFVLPPIPSKEAATFIADMRTATNTGELGRWGKDNGEAIGKLKDAEANAVRQHYAARMKALKDQAAAEAQAMREAAE
jgi:hypothetical protein